MGVSEILLWGSSRSNYSHKAGRMLSFPISFSPELGAEGGLDLPEATGTRGPKAEGAVRIQLSFIKPTSVTGKNLKQHHSFHSIKK